MTTNEPIQWSPGVTLKDIERQVILKAYAFYLRNKTQTSIALGISVRTLDERLEKYGEDDEARKEADAKRKAESDEFLRRSRGIVPEYPPTANAPVPYPGGTASRVEGAKPTSTASPEQSMPVPKRTQVQDMLPPKVAATGSRSRSG